MTACPVCGYMRAGFDGFCERCAEGERRPRRPAVRPTRNVTLDEIRDDLERARSVRYVLPDGEPQMALSHVDYLDFLRRLQAHPMTEGEIAERIIARLDRVAAGRADPDETVHPLEEMKNLSEISLTDSKIARICDIVIRHVAARTGGRF